MKDLLESDPSETDVAPKAISGRDWIETSSIQLLTKPFAIYVLLEILWFWSLSVLRYCSIKIGFNLVEY